MSIDPGIREKLTQIIHEVNPEIFVVEMEVHRSKTSTVRILIDTDEGIQIGECRHVSRKISRYLEEEEDLFPFRYHLEVGSPGVGKPLKLLRQYHKNRGRNLKVRFKDGREFEGELMEVGEDHIVLQPEVKKKKKKKPGNKNEEEDSGPLTLNFEDIHEAKVLVSFK